MRENYLLMPFCLVVFVLYPLSLSFGIFYWSLGIFICLQETAHKVFDTCLVQNSNLEIDYELINLKHIFSKQTLHGFATSLNANHMQPHLFNLNMIMAII